MTVDAMILAGGAAMVYGWLCATIAPIAFALNRLMDTRGEGRAWRILALAAGGALLWTTIAAAAAMLATVLAPSVALAVLLSPVTVPALSLGVMVWGLEVVTTARLPRVGPAFELDSALALVHVLGPDSHALGSAERIYGPFLIGEDPEPAAANGRRSAVCRVTA